MNLHQPHHQRTSFATGRLPNASRNHHQTSPSTKPAKSARRGSERNLPEIRSRTSCLRSAVGASFFSPGSGRRAAALGQRSVFPERRKCGTSLLARRIPGGQGSSGRGGKTSAVRIPSSSPVFKFEFRRSRGPRLGFSTKGTRLVSAEAPAAYRRQLFLVADP